ncbi:MAG: glycosyltransferase family 4 protein [Candidatus Omnitrophota bacterium]
MKLFDVGLDVRMFRHTGIGTYLRGLVGGMGTGDRGNGLRLGLFGDPGHFGAHSQFPLERFTTKIYSVAEQWRYPGCLRKCRLWHSPHYNIPVLPSKTKLVVTIHDLIHFIFQAELRSPAKAAYARFMLRRAVRRAHHIIAVSRHTRDDCVRLLGADPEKITVIYEAVAGDLYSRGYGLSGSRKQDGPPYFLYVGLLKPHKQVHRLLRNFRQLRAEGKIRAELVIVGRKDRAYASEYRELAQLQDGKEGVRYFSHLPDEELLRYYQGALALIHPSRYEGFGLTLLEGMAAHIPVLCSRAASLPEVAGDAALWFSPDSDPEMQAAMVRIERDGALRQELIAKGAERVKQFDWESAAQKTLTVYRKVLES